MPLSPFPITSFPGLDLRSEPDEQGGAIDLLNVDFDKVGSIRSRNGYTKFNVAAPPAKYYAGLAPFYTIDGNAHLLAGTWTAGLNALLQVLDNGGAVSTSLDSGVALGSGNPVYWHFAPLGTPTAQSVYALAVSGTAPATGKAAFKYDGTTITNVTAALTIGGLVPIALGATPVDNRLVLGGLASSSTLSRVQFSDPGAPTTFGANNYVDLTPGDGESIQQILAWNNQLFVFKQTKFFVFYGTSTDGSGNPVFNYRAISTAGITSRNAAAASPHGIYFVNQRGVYLTTGTTPQLVSQPFDSLFNRATLSPYYTGPGTFDATQARVAWIDGRLYISQSGLGGGGSSAYNLTVVYDPEAQAWFVWDIPMASVAPINLGQGTTDDVFFGTYANSGVGVLGHLVRRLSSQTTDNGTAITSRYRYGFMALNYIRRFRGHYVEVPSQEATVRRTTLDGQGSVNFSLSRDFNVTVPTTGGGSESQVTMGTAPATKQGSYMTAQRGRRLSWQARDVNGGAWKLNSITLHVRGSTDPAMATAQDNT